MAYQNAFRVWRAKTPSEYGVPKRLQRMAYQNAFGYGVPKRLRGMACQNAFGVWRAKTPYAFWRAKTKEATDD
jgi:hypothetical protein